VIDFYFDCVCVDTFLITATARHGRFVKDKFGEIETGLAKDYPLILLFTASHFYLLSLQQVCPH